MSRKLTPEEREIAKERRRIYWREWYHRNPDKVKASYERLKDQKRPGKAAFMKKWRAENPERAKEISRLSGRRKLACMTPGQKKASVQRSTEWKKAHPVETKAATKRYSQKNLDRLRAKGRRYVAENAERVAANGRQWRQANPDKVVIKEQRRRARIKQAPGQGVTTEQWQELQASYIGLCAYCNAPSAPLTMDHVDPISRGGAHDISNIAPACTRCNVSKNNSPLIVWLARRQRRSA